MSLPDPVPGLVISYAYLWRDEALRGQDEGRKDRPCVVVLAVEEAKGAEFDRVLVVLDDEEGNYNLFSYGKYFGLTPLSARDNENIADGADSVLGRTRRLLYVCCSRALQDLAVVLFVPDPDQSRDTIVARNLFPANDVLTLADLARNHDQQPA